MHGDARRRHDDRQLQVIAVRPAPHPSPPASDVIRDADLICSWLITPVHPFDVTALKTCPMPPSPILSRIV